MDRKYVWTCLNAEPVFSGDLVKSYDFMFTKDSYVVGTVIDRAPVDFLCSGTEYLHIRILADCRIVDGEEARNYERMGEMCYVACVEPELGGARINSYVEGF